MSRAFCLGLIVVSVAMYASCSKVIETWQTGHGDFEVRITSYSDPGIIIQPGAQYVFESSRGTGNWKTVFSVHLDLAEPIDKESVQIIDEGIAYIHMRQLFASTTNGGVDWHLWDSRNHRFFDKSIKWGVIESVIVDKM